MSDWLCALCLTRPARKRPRYARDGPPATSPRTWCCGSTGRTRERASWAARWPDTPGACSARSARGRPIPGWWKPSETGRRGCPSSRYRAWTSGAPGWEQRTVSADLNEVLWQRLGLARFMLRKAPVGVELVRDDLPAEPGRQRVRITAKASTPVVTVTGSPAELTLWTLGRTAAAQVRLDGNETAIEKLAAPGWRH